MSFALTIAAYGAMDLQLDESSDNSVIVNGFARRTVAFASIILGVRSIHL